MIVIESVFMIELRSCRMRRRASDSYYHYIDQGTIISLCFDLFIRYLVIPRTIPKVHTFARYEVRSARRYEIR